MASVLDVPGLLLPSADRGIAAIGQGLEQRFANQAEQKRLNALSQIGQMVQGGDYSGAAGQAFGMGDLKTGMDIMQMSQAEQAQAEAIIGRALVAADTPEKWQRVMPAVAQRLGSQGQRFMQEFGDFSQRETALDVLGARPEPPSAAEQLAIAKFSHEVTQDENEPPETIEGFDEQGRQITLYWDKGKRDYFPLKQAGAKPPSQGITVTTDADGNTITTIGGSAGSGLGKTALNTIEGKQINTAEVFSRMAGIMADWKPEYQTLGTKFANAVRSGKAWIDPAMLDEGDEQALSSFVQVRTKAINNLSQFLNELSGAAISPQEAVRLTNGMPNPGTGIFDGDDPITFKAKAEAVMNEMQRAAVRYEYYKAFGFPADLGQIPLNNVRKVGAKWYVQDAQGWVEVGMP